MEAGIIGYSTESVALHRNTVVTMSAGGDECRVEQEANGSMEWRCGLKVTEPRKKRWSRITYNYSRGPTDGRVIAMVAVVNGSEQVGLAWVAADSACVVGRAGS